MAGLHPLDLAIVIAYFAVVILLGKRAARDIGSYEGFFLAGRKLGKTYQFFLNFGQSTDANGAVTTASLVYQQGVSGVWMSLQLIFLNPYFWFMNLWFRRARLVTMADLFVDRLGSNGLARFYALFQALSLVFVVVGFGNLVTYKISSAFIVKPESAWTVQDRAAAQGYHEHRQLEQNARAGRLSGAEAARLATLREQDARGELRSHIPLLGPLPFYFIYTLVVGGYIVMGGMKAAAMNDIMQSLLIVAFSAILIPVGFSAIGGPGALAERVPRAMFELISTDVGIESITGIALFAIFLAALVQINGIPGNMGISGSARNEFAARFGAVSGTYCKRFMIIMWAFCGLIAVALFQGDLALSDPDTAWGVMSRMLLGPGLLGLMITGVLAANMSTVAAETLSVSALFVRYVYMALRPRATPAESVVAARWAIVAVLAIGVFAAMSMTNIFSVLQLVQTINVPFGASVLLIFLWRQLTIPAVWSAVLVSAMLNIVAPRVLPLFEGLRAHPVLTERSHDPTGRPAAVYFESVIRTDISDLEGPLEGRGRLHTELVLLRVAGIDVGAWYPSTRFAARFLMNVLTPFALLFAVSLVTRAPPRGLTDQFFGKMKTPVGDTPEQEAEAVQATIRDPHRFNCTKLFPTSSWEMTKWNRVDAIGFAACCAVSGGIIALFWGLLRLAEA